MCLLIGAGLVILIAVAATGLSTTWDAIQHRAAPRTVAATQLNLALNDMDAQAANILLSSGDSGTGKGRLDESYSKANGFYGDAQQTISRSLRTLGAASEGDTVTEDTVVALTDDFAHYQELIGRALENDGHPGGKDAARADYRQATDLLAEQLLPQARKLVDANNAVYEGEYEAARTDLEVQLVTEAVLGVLLLVVLVVLQVRLARSFRRVFNPALVAAALCALFAVVCGSRLLAVSVEQLKVARHDSFDSVVALSRAKAIGYDANADESRFLLDATRRDLYEKSFLDKSQQLYGLDGASISSYDAKLDQTWAAYQRDHGDEQFTGEYRRELDNITFAGEREAAEKTVEAYAVYQKDDRTFRRLIAEGKTQEATVFCIGWASDTSNAHFGVWTKALDQVTAINSAHHEAAIATGRDAVNTQAPTAAGALLLGGGLLILGLRPRLAEFR
ncbi:hypothetical protein [Streptomyces sp. WM6378]|uniref:hypothetical protein n=1 Tax=Streptomyces sp. WM6378 TaxID=1415557 RepID=UPI0006AFAD41|nr:hypothetical protein [Streptomyces sp. WM6378]KOU51976.1 hypothetical protein ADK54_08040 [Streptomyces sp. WM6378]